MNDLIITSPEVAYGAATIKYDFSGTDRSIDEIEKRYSGLVGEKKEIKSICAELNKLKKALNDEGIRIEKESTAGIKEFRKELKKRTDRIDSIRSPLWEQVKPVKKEEHKKESKKIRITLMFEGDENYIIDMITDAEINGIMVWEVK